MAKQRGLTLLEMLVSILILTLVLSMVSSAYSYYVTGFNRQHSRLVDSFSQIKRSFLWQDQLAAATEYYLEISPRTYRVFFDGRANELSWIVSIDSNRKGEQAVAWLGILNGYLSYCEQPFSVYLPKSSVQTSDEVCKSRLQIIVPADEFKVHYFGWSNLESRQNAILEPLPGRLPDHPQWFREYLGSKTNTLPLWVRLEVSKDGTIKQYWVQIEAVDMQKLAVFGTENHG